MLYSKRQNAETVILHENIILLQTVAQARVYVRECVRVCGVRACVRECVHAHARACVCVCVCARVCMYVWEWVLGLL